MNCSLRFAALLVCCLAGAGCATSDKPAHTVTMEHERDKPQKCLGAGGDRNICIQIASQRCYSGFDLLDLDAAGEDGVVRSGLYFKCKP